MEIKNFIIIAILCLMPLGVKASEQFIKVKVTFDLVKCYKNQENQDVCPPQSYPENMNINLKQQNQEDFDNDRISGNLILQKTISNKVITGLLNIEKYTYSENDHYFMINLKIIKDLKVLSKISIGSENINQLSDIFLEADKIKINDEIFLPIFYVGKKI
jgi:hypothetical protein